MVSVYRIVDLEGCLNAGSRLFGIDLQEGLLFQAEVATRRGLVDAVGGNFFRPDTVERVAKIEVSRGTF